MLAEFLNALSNKLDEARKPLQLEVEGIPADRVMLAMPDGEIKVQMLAEGPKIHCALDLDSLVRVTVDGENPKIWYGPHAVFGYSYGHEPGQWPDKIKFPLNYTSKWKILLGLAERSFDQPSFLKLLRIHLDGSVPADFIHQVRKLLFTTQSEAKGQIDRQKSSMGSSVKRELETETAVPEEIMVSVRPYVELEYGVTIRCAVEIDLEAKRFQLIPLPEELDNGQSAAMVFLESQLVGLVGEQEVPIYFGVANVE